ncbi:MAG: NRDE family protein [Cyclobacteriaceae bacterium]
MCLIFIALKNHSKYKLIVAANRDEFYDRKTEPASFWQDHPEILGGRDLEAMGTWLGMTKSGRICMVTNFRDLKNINPNAPSRGKLVTDFLLDKTTGEEYLKKVETRARKYNGFSLIAGTVDSLYYLSNYRDGVILLNSGLFGLSNHLLETPWPKVEKGKIELQALLKGPVVDADDLFRVLSDDKIGGDEQLPDTGVGLELERALSAAFIKSPGYGTRSSTVILVDYHNHVVFHERVYDPVTSGFSNQSFQFTIG